MSKGSVPNQRNITIKKEKADKNNLYSINNLDALNQAAFVLQSKGGFKLYIYLAKNQDKYNFDLSSHAFLEWSGLGYTAYTTAFKELVDEGYLVLKPGTETVYTFYEKSLKAANGTITIEYPQAAAERDSSIKAAISKEEFVF